MTSMVTFKRIEAIEKSLGLPGQAAIGVPGGVDPTVSKRLGAIEAKLNGLAKLVNDHLKLCDATRKAKGRGKAA